MFMFHLFIGNWTFRFRSAPILCAQSRIWVSYGEPTWTNRIRADPNLNDLNAHCRVAQESLSSILYNCLGLLSGPCKYSTVEGLPIIQDTVFCLNSQKIGAVTDGPQRFPLFSSFLFCFDPPVQCCYDLDAKPQRRKNYSTTVDGRCSHKILMNLFIELPKPGMALDLIQDHFQSSAKSRMPLHESRPIYCWACSTDPWNIEY